MSMPLIFKSKVHFFSSITINFVIDFIQLILTIAILDRFFRNLIMSGFPFVYSCSLMLVDMLIHVLQHQIGFVHLEEGA